MACDGKDCKYRDKEYYSMLIWKSLMMHSDIDFALEFNEITPEEAEEQREWTHAHFKKLRDRGPFYKLPEVIERMKT
jgi:hypothetical protein